MHRQPPPSVAAAAHAEAMRRRMAPNQRMSESVIVIVVDSIAPPHGMQCNASWQPAAKVLWQHRIAYFAALLSPTLSLLCLLRLFPLQPLFSRSGIRGSYSI